jgi:hypothetical protein
MHYLSGKIDVELFLPISCFQTIEQSEQLQKAFQAAIGPLSDFRKVRLWFG